MFEKKRWPVLTGTSCDRVEKLRTAIEVLTGKQVHLLQLDLKRGEGKIGLGNKSNETTYREFDISFYSGREDLVEFKLDAPLNTTAIDWNIACFEKSGKVLVINQANPRNHKCGFRMRWIGYSATDRWEEPLFDAEARLAASQHGVSYEEYLRSLEIPSPPPRYFHELKPGDLFMWGNNRCVVVQSVHGENFAVPLEGEQRGTIIHPARYADIRQVAL